MTYAKAVTQLDTFLERDRRPRVVADLRREDVKAFLLGLQDVARQPATVAQRFRSLQQFLKWLAEEGEIELRSWICSTTTNGAVGQQNALRRVTS